MSNIYSNIMLDLRKVDGVKMLALAGRDGFLIGENPSDETETMTRLFATMLNTTENVSRKLNKVSTDRLIVDFDGGKIIMMKAGQKAFISVMAAQGASVDPIMAELEKAAGKIKKIL